MADDLSLFATVTISANTRTPTRQGFGTTLFLTYHTKFPELYRTYSRASELLDDGFLATDVTYLKLAAHFGESPRPKQAIVGRLPVAPTFTYTVTVAAAVEDDVRSFKFLTPAGVATTATYTVGNLEDQDDAATALALVLDGVSGISASAVGAVITATASQKLYFYEPGDVKFAETTADSNYDDQLTILENEDIDFYFVETDSVSQANVEKVAAWAGADGTRAKMYVFSTNEDNIRDGTDTWLAALKTANTTSTKWIWHDRPQEEIAAAFTAFLGAADPGSVTTEFAQFRSKTPSSLTTTQRTNIAARNGSIYISKRNRQLLHGAKMLDGEWVDIEHGIDALASRIQEDLFAHLASGGKKPFRQKYLDAIQTRIESSCRVFARDPGLLKPETIVVEVPAEADISAADQELRQLNDVYFEAKLQGAIHFVGVTGVVSYSDAEV